MDQLAQKWSAGKGRISGLLLPRSLEQDQRARRFAAIGSIILVGSTSILGFLLFFQGNASTPQSKSDVWLTVATISVALALLVLNKRGHIELAGYLLVGGVLLYAIFAAYQEGHPPTDLASAQAFLLVIVLAVVMLPSNMAWLISGLAALSFSGLQILWQAGLLPAPVERSSPGDLGFTILAWLITSLIILLLMQSLSSNLRRQTNTVTRRFQQLDLLYQAGKLLGQSLSLDTVYNQTYEAISTMLGCDGLVISSYDESQEMISCARMWVDDMSIDVSGFPTIPLEPEGYGTQSRVIRSGTSLYIADFKAALQQTRTAYLVSSTGAVLEPKTIPEDAQITQSSLIVPLIYEDKVIGVLQARSYELDAFSQDELRMVEALAPGIAIATVNASLYEQVQRELHERELAEAEILRLNHELETRIIERTEKLKLKQDEADLLNQAMLNMLEDLKLANQWLEAGKQELTRVNQELESFSYSVSHDLRAPLRAIDGFTRLLMEESGQLDEQKEEHYLQMVRESAQNMGKLIDDLLAFSRLGKHELKRKRIELRSLFETVFLQLSELEPDRKIELELQDLPDCEADPTLIKQVIVNLLGNAIKFTRTRATARVEVGSLGGKLVGNEITYYVRDNGVGFDMRYVDKLFGVFQRLHSADEFEGTGVGLALVQRIINRHGGSVWAESEIDHGTSIFFTLGGDSDAR